MIRSSFTQGQPQWTASDCSLKVPVLFLPFQIDTAGANHPSDKDEFLKLSQYPAARKTRTGRPIKPNQ
jgi:hypothetical protein